MWPKLRDRDFSFTARAAADVPPATLARIDTLWSLVQATLGGDPLVCQVFLLHYLTEALEAGETSRIVVGLCAYFVVVDVAYSAVAGFKPKSLQRAEGLCQKLDDPRCQGWLAFARAFAFQNQGMLKPAALDFALAEELFRTRCRDVAPELSACRMLFAHVKWMMEQLEELGVCGQWIRDAMEREDIMVATRLRLIMLPRLLAEDDVSRARRLLVVPEELRSGGQSLTDLLSFNAQTSFALYQDDPDALHEAQVASALLDASPLLVVRIWRTDQLLQRARLLLASSTRDADPSTALAGAEKALDGLEELGLECHVDSARVLRAALAYRRGSRTLALELLDALLLDADTQVEGRHLLSCARLRKGQLLGGEAGRELVADAVRVLSRRGVKEPLHFARIYAPGFEDVGESSES